MESVNSNSPVLSRALEFAREAKRERDVDQHAAVKADNPAQEQHANQVSFSQAAQIKLSEEKTQDLNRVEAVRVENRTRADEQRSQAMDQQAARAAATRTENKQLRLAKDEAARANAAETAKAVAENDKVQQAFVEAAKQIKALETDKAIQADSKLVKEALDKTNVAVAERNLAAQKKVDDDTATKINADAALQSEFEHKKSNDSAAQNTGRNKAIDRRLKTELDEAVKMYKKISGVI